MTDALTVVKRHFPVIIAIVGAALVVQVAHRRLDVGVAHPCLYRTMLATLIASEPKVWRRS